MSYDCILQHYNAKEDGSDRHKKRVLSKLRKKKTLAAASVALLIRRLIFVSLLPVPLNSLIRKTFFMAEIF